MNSSDDKICSPLPACMLSAAFKAAALLALLSVSSVIHAQSSPLERAANESQVVRLSSAYSPSDIVRLRAQARGQGGNTYVAYPQLILNGRPTAYMLPVQVYGEELTIDTQALASQGVTFPAQASSKQWQTLGQLNITGHYDNSAQQISLVVPANWLPQQTLEVGFSLVNSPVQRGQGILINYDAYSSWLDNGEQTLSAAHELRAFDDWGVVSSSGVVRWSDSAPDNGDYIRLDSYWRYTDPNRMRTYMVGDTISDALTWSPSIRLGGVQIGRNFSSRPDLITFPLPQIHGSATLPSALEVFVNDLRLSDQTVQPGPFVVETSPMVTGFGEVQVVTTDTLGRETAQTVPFYVSPKLLKKGYWDYSASLGAPRRFYGQRANDYDNQVVATGVARYGFNNTLTLESTLNASGTLTNGGAGMVIRSGLLGVSNLSIAHGSDSDDQGNQWVAGHEFRTQRYSISGQYTERTRGYKDLSNSIDLRIPIKSSTQLNGSVSFGQQGNLNVSYLETRLFNGPDTRFLVLGHSRSLWQQLSLTLSVNQNLEASSDRTWLAGFTYRLDKPSDRPIQAGARINHNEKTENTETLLTLRQHVRDFWDLGWDLAYSPDANGTRQARGRWWTPYGDIQAGVYGQDGENNSFASLSGSLVSNYQDLFAANTMNNSFAIVDTGGYAGIPVRQSNRVIGKTNHKGRLLLPDIIPFTENELAIDIDDLPVDAQSGARTLTIKPAELTGVTARFDIARQNSAIVVIHNAQGKPVPAGAKALLADADATVVGYDGEVFLQGITEGKNEIDIISNGELCTVIFNFAANPGTLPRLGPYQCLPPSAR
ncbi:fimbria/pilus outer membrane usher protein [uncultured Alcanivorax sp.]|uniref:fimbria/pilus outer membrane usher protein n=1 Tax=uncultured Alcanivorax sp. TaxID=191215 RepID=UPI00258B0FBF|nr:fimbria/pilus outer membrane usher protein [uncultured Alcanivorax sp.]